MDELKESKVIRLLSAVFNIKTFIITGALLLMASSFLGWMDQPIKGWLKGKTIQLSENIPPIISYGSLCLLAGLLSLGALSNRLRWISILSGAIGIMLSLHFFLSFSLFDSKKVIDINNLNQQEKHILSFNKYLPPNIGTEPTFDASVTTGTVKERLYATLHFATFGWYAAILGSLSLFFAFLKSGANKNIKKLLFLIIPFIILYLVLTTFPYVLAEYHLNKGDRYIAHGMYIKAIDEYEQAKQLDKNADYLKSFHINLGKAYFFLGRSDRADYYIYKATKLMQERNFPEAVFYLTIARSVEPPISKTVGNSFLSWAYVTYGLSEYRKGITSSAIQMWRKSLEIDPSQIQSYFFLSRAHYDISSYDESIMAGLQFMKLSKNKIMRSNVSSNIADSYYKLQKYDIAREYYMRSLFLDKYQNIRAVMSLVGK